MPSHEKSTVVVVLSVDIWGPTLPVEGEPHCEPRGSRGEENESGAMVTLGLRVFSSGSIEIDDIDVSNLRRFSSRRNRIGSNRTNVTKSSVQWEFEYTFFALTLNPMGKRRCLEIEEYAGDTSRKTPAGVCGQANGSIEQKDSFTLQAEFRYLVVFTAGLLSSSPRNQFEAFRPFNGVYTFYIFKWHHGDEMRLKHYAGILLIEF